MTNESIVEEWRSVKGFEGMYEVSNIGRVKSVERVSIRVNGRRKPVPGCIRKQVMVHGYHIVELKRPTFKKRMRVHRLVLLAFLGEPIGLSNDCNHKDGNKSNNCIDNLEWVTRKENIRHSFETGLKVNPSGSDCPASKLTKDDVDAVVFMRSTMTARQLATLLNVTSTAIRNILNGRTWGHHTGIEPKRSKACVPQSSL